MKHLIGFRPNEFWYNSLNTITKTRVKNININLDPLYYNRRKERIFEKV